MSTFNYGRMHQLRRVQPEIPQHRNLRRGSAVGAERRDNAAEIKQDIYYIVPSKCTECVGFFDQEQCAAVCPVDCCIPNPNIPGDRRSLD